MGLFNRAINGFSAMNTKSKIATIGVTGALGVGITKSLSDPSHKSDNYRSMNLGIAAAAMGMMAGKKGLL